MKLHSEQALYPLGMVLFGWLLAAYKAASLAFEMGADWHQLGVIAGLDALFLTLLSAFALLAAIARHWWFRAIAYSVLVAATFLYLVDSFVLLALDEHASLFEIGRYAPEWGVVLSFFDTAVYLAILLWLISLFVFVRSTHVVKKIGVVFFVFALLSTAANSVHAPVSLRHYAMIDPLALLELTGSQQAETVYSTQELQFYGGLKREAVTVPASKPDIVLLIVESLSSINSKKLSGHPGMLDGFDKLAEEGVLFTNFFANHQASEGGLIALLGGFPPIHFPTASPLMFDEFAIQASVLDEYRQLGYFTEFLTNADLAFIGLDHFLNGLGLDRSRGRDEVADMRNAPRVVQDAPSDVYLYREAMLTVRQRMPSEQPFLLTLATTSTHLPYTHPEGGPDTPAAVWEWSMQQLLRFYAELSASGFFDHGILLITGDHRQMRPLQQFETERYGDSARARVPLLLIGNDYVPGLIDERFFQQSDLLRLLGSIHESAAALSPHPVWVERYNRKYGRIELINNLSVFDEADQGRTGYRLKVPGNHIYWPGEKPGFARAVETRIHIQRSLHQQARQRLSHVAFDNH
jgi:hypothetical protein